MQSTATTVDEYLKAVPAERLEAMTRLRAACVTHLTGYTEGMTYGMPSYGKNGKIEVAFNSQKNYISLYVPTEVLSNYKDSLKNLGKGCVRYKKPEDIDFEIVQKMLQNIAA